MSSEGNRQRGGNSEQRWTSAGYGERNVHKVWRGTGETLLVRGESREKVRPINRKAKGREGKRESERVVVPEDEDNTTSSSPSKDAAREGPVIESTFVERVSRGHGSKRTQQLEVGKSNTTTSKQTVELCQAEQEPEVPRVVRPDVPDGRAGGGMDTSPA